MTRLNKQYLTILMLRNKRHTHTQKIQMNNVRENDETLKQTMSKWKKMFNNVVLMNND